MVIFALLVVLSGVTTGWFLAGAKTKPSSDGDSSQPVVNEEGIQTAGVGDEDDYDSTAEGILKKGGVNGEGTHYLDRGLGENKYVSLTSSVVDLNAFVDKNVALWGETISVDPKRASWKIDVGLVKEKE